MKKVGVTYLFITFLAVLLSGFNIDVDARQTLGVLWEPPSDPAIASSQLDQFTEFGVSYLELSHPVEPEITSLLTQYNFTVLIRIDLAFFTINEIEHSKQQLLEQYTDAADEYRNVPHVAALGLLSNSQTYHPEFDAIYQPLVDSLSYYSNKEHYFYANSSWYYFDAPEQPFAISFNGDVFENRDLVILDAEFQNEINKHTEILYFFSSNWLIEAIDNYPQLKESLIEYNESNRWNLPLPDLSEKGQTFNWPVILLLLLWAGLAIQLKYLPYIRPMIMRYYFAHRFFVDDILQYRERAVTGSVLLLIKHAFFGGIVFYIIAKITFSQAGIEALFHHWPILLVAGEFHISFFITGTFFIVIIQIIALLWLYLPAKNLKHISQTINLYAGAFYLDYVFVTLMVTLYMAGINHTVLFSLAIVFILIWFMAFNIAALDISRAMTYRRLLYLSLTIGLHAIVSIILIMLLYMSPEFIQVLDLAISL